MNDTTKLYLLKIDEGVKDVKEKCSEIRGLSQEQSDKLSSHLLDDTRRFDRLDNQVTDIQTAALEVAEINRQRKATRVMIWAAIIGAFATAGFTLIAELIRFVKK